jgi:hypothetical protein
LYAIRPLSCCPRETPRPPVSTGTV